MAGQVRRLWLEPNDAPAFPPVIKAILNADMVVVGPGSLYTSLLPNLLVKDLLGAIHASRAVKVYVCNIATQSGETDMYSCYDHVHALEEHLGDSVFDVLLCNDNYEASSVMIPSGCMRMKRLWLIPAVMLQISQIRITPGVMILSSWQKP